MEDKMTINNAPCTEPTVDTIVTHDIYAIAAFLLFGGEIDFDGIDRTNPRRVTIPCTGKGLNKIQREWDDGTLTGSLKKYSHLVRDVKAIVQRDNP